MRTINPLHDVMSNSVGMFVKNIQDWFTRSKNPMIHALCCFVFLVCSGCASYLHFGEQSYQELDEKNKQMRAEKHMINPPGTGINPYLPPGSPR